MQDANKEQNPVVNNQINGNRTDELREGSQLASNRQERERDEKDSSMSQDSTAGVVKSKKENLPPTAPVIVLQLSKFYFCRIVVIFFLVVSNWRREEVMMFLSFGAVFEELKIRPSGMCKGPYKNPHRHGLE